MKLFNIRVAVVVAGLALAAGPALAQDPKGGGGAPGGGASERGGGGGGAAATNAASAGGGNIASGGGGSSASGGGGFSSPSIGSASSAPLSVSDRGFAMAAPQHRLGYTSDGAQSHTASSGQHASPRSSGSSSGGSSNRGSAGGQNTAAPRSSAASSDGARARGSDNQARARTPSAESSSTNNANANREVPTWGRPRGDRPATGTAVPRTVPPDRSGDALRGRVYDPYYDPFGFGVGYGYGYGYYGSYFSPYYMPYGFGMGYGLSPFGWNPYGFYGDPMDPYAYGAGYGSYSSQIYNSHDQGALKLKVKPRTAKVYVDGYFVGTVDQFDGAFQKLTLNTGSHKVEVKADGYQTAEFDVLITPEHTITFAGELKRNQ